MITASMRHHDPEIGRRTILYQRQDAFVIRPELLDHFFEGGRILGELAEHGAMHVITQSHLHHVGHSTRNGCDVGLLRSRGHSQMAKLVSDPGPEADQYSRGYGKQ